MTNQSSKNSSGLPTALAAFGLWGFLPIYWKALSQVPAEEILAHRILWSFIFIIALAVVSGHFRKVLSDARSLLGHRKKLFCAVVGALLITVNWFTYIWAVNHNHIVETSLGYYINPLVNILLGVTIFRERLSFWQFAAILLAAAGVVNLTWQFGSLPWVAVILAVSMGFYSLCKKVTGLSAISGMAIETSLTVPFAAIYFVFLYSGGQGAISDLNLTVLLLIGGGVVTAVPLLLFTHSITRIPLSIMGIIQYLSPTMALLIGVAVYGEPFTKAHQVSFAFIWGGLLIFTIAKTPAMKRLERLLAGNRKTDR